MYQRGGLFRTAGEAPAPDQRRPPPHRRPQRGRYAAARTPQEAQDHQEPLAPPPEEWPPESELELKDELLDELDESDESD